MKIHNFDQGTPEWFAARAGVVTASNFTTARERLKNGAPSAAAKALAFRLAIERIAGEPIEGTDWAGWQAQRGTALEPIARDLFALSRGVIVEDVGFCSTDCGRFGCSPDGFIGSGSGLEIKCFLAPEKLRAILVDADLSSVLDQIQGGMWVTGRRQWSFALYCPALAAIGSALTVYTVGRDPEYIAALEADLLEFDALVAGYVKTLEQHSGPDQRPIIQQITDLLTPTETDPFAELQWT